MNHNEETPDNLGGLGGMLPADVLKELNRLLAWLHQVDLKNFGSHINLIYVSADAQRSDAVLFLQQHLDDVEKYLQQQSADGLTGQHYQNLLLQIKKIREKYESGK